MVLPVSLPPSIYTSQSSSEKVGSFSPPLGYGLVTCLDQENDAEPVVGPALKRLASAFILLEVSHHVVRKLSLDC